MNEERVRRQLGQVKERIRRRTLCQPAYNRVWNQVVGLAPKVFLVGNQVWDQAREAYNE